MKILMVSSEAIPFAKAGGLGDVVTALSLALRRQRHDVRLLIPRYRSIDRDGLELMPGPLGVPMGDHEYWTGVYVGELPDPKGSHPVPTYFIDHEQMFDRQGIYGDASSPWYQDNPTRFALLSRAAFQLCRKVNWIPDVMHAHDWPTSLIPVYSRWFERESDFSRTASVLSIHNLGYQGITSRSHLPSLGIPNELLHESGLDSGGDINLLKAGISCADGITTVSPRYAREITTPEQGFGLDALVRARNGVLSGILNGIDYDVWNPETDPLLPYHYSHTDLSNKTKLRQLLQVELDLVVTERPALIGMVSRLTGQKGFYELCDPQHGILKRILEVLPVQVIILGSGESQIEASLHDLGEAYSNLAVKIGYDERTSHLIEAAADFFLMPSRYEPCGLNQMYSLRYGTIPIANRTGGLADTIEPYDPDTGTGTGFWIDGASPWLIFDAVRRAVDLHQSDPEEITRMRLRGMEKRFPWEASAAAYVEVYRRAVDRLAGVSV